MGYSLAAARLVTPFAQTLERIEALLARAKRIEALLARAKGALGQDPGRARQLLAQAHSLAQTAVSGGLGLSFED